MAFDVTTGFYEGKAVYNQGVYRVTSENSAADNFNGIAITINTAFPFVYYLFLHYKRLWKKIFLGIMLALFVMTLVLTGSRGGLLGFIVLLGCIWWMSRHKTIGIIAFMVFSIIGWFSIGAERQRRYESIFDSNLDESSLGRVNAWHDGLILFLERPLTGVGADAFLQARVDRFGVYLDPHNLYIHVFAELGLIGGGIFFFMLLRDIFRINLRVIRQVKTRGSPHALLVPFARATILACISLLVTGIFAHSTFRYTWYLLAALTVVSEQFIRKSADLDTVNGQLPDSSLEPAEGSSPASQ